MGNEKRNLIEDIINNYDIEEQLVVEQLNFVNHHGPTLGTFREEIWQDLFAKIIPKKFSIERSVFLIDSKGRTSSEVDLAIFDEMYTPYIFRKGKIKYIPIEAVAVAIQCKSTGFDGISDWANSIKKLKTCNKSIARMATNICIESAKTQLATRPIIILCSIANPSKLSSSTTNDFDFFVYMGDPKSGEHGIKVDVPNGKYSLFDWYNELNNYSISKEKALTDDNSSANVKQQDKKEKEEKHLKSRTLNNYQINSNNYNTSLLTLNFQLNQLLMLINNPMLFPHQAYVEMFNKISKEKTDGNDTENRT